MLGILKYYIKFFDLYFLASGVLPLLTTISNNSIKIKKLIIINVIMITLSIVAVCHLIFVNQTELYIFNQAAKYGIANTIFVMNQKIMLFLSVITISYKIKKIGQQKRVYRKNMKFLTIVLTRGFDQQDVYRKFRNLYFKTFLKILYDLYSISFSMKLSSLVLSNKNILFSFQVYYPFYFINTNMTLFFCGNQRNHLLLKSLNSLLELKIKEFNTMKMVRRMQGDECCELSDFIDQISYLHRKIVGIINEWVNLCALPALIFLMDSFCTLAFRPFCIYTTIMKMQTDLNEQIDILKLAMSINILGSKLLHIAILMLSCQNLIDRFRETGNLLHHINISEIDVRLKESIKLFSLQMLQNPLTLMPFGLFSLDNGLWFMLLSSSVAYFIILIQFQIDI